MHLNKQLVEKTKESMASVLPITAIVLLLSITAAPLESGTLVLFLFGAVLLVGGMGLFTLGVDMSMIPMGEGVGVEMSRCKTLIVPLADHFYTVTPNNPRAMESGELARRIRAMGAKATPCGSVADGVAAAMKDAGRDGVCCALGSLYMSGDVRDCFLKQ